MNVSELIKKWKEKAGSVNLTEMLEGKCTNGNENYEDPNSRLLL